MNIFNETDYLEAYIHTSMAIICSIQLIVSAVQGMLLETRKNRTSLSLVLRLRASIGVSLEVIIIYTHNVIAPT